VSVDEIRDIVQSLGGPAARAEAPSEPWLIVDVADDPGQRGAYHALRRQEFVDRQGLFHADDSDDSDGNPATRVLVALAPNGAVMGGVRIHPAGAGTEAVGWWQGSRLVVDAATGRARGRTGTSGASGSW
jgi:hypothetical protein